MKDKGFFLTIQFSSLPILVLWYSFIKKENYLQYVERSSSTPKTTKRSVDLQPRSRAGMGEGESVYGKLLKGNSKSRRILARLLSRILGWSDTNSEAFLRTWLWRILAKIGLSWMKDKDQVQDLIRKRVQGSLTQISLKRESLSFSWVNYLNLIRNVLKYQCVSI